MRLSVVIPAYNAAAFIGEALDSVSAQTLPADEIIVVDDGSTDSTAALASAAGARVISIANVGLSAARNVGVEAARGEWVALLDADDLWHPEKLARQFRALAAAPDIDVSACDHYQFDSSGELMPSALRARQARYDAIAPQELEPGSRRLIQMGTGLITLGMLLIPSTLVLRRSSILAIGGFDPMFRRIEDLEFLLRLLTRTDVAFVESVMMGYRRHPSGLSNHDEAMALGHVALGESMRRQPERYASDVFHAYASQWREALLQSASFALARGDRELARQHLVKAGAVGRNWRWFKLALASTLPIRVSSALRAWLRARERGSQ